MAKKGGKDKGAKGKDKKGKKGKAEVKPKEPEVEKKEEPKEEKKDEPKPEIKEKVIDEPCLFNCAQDKVTYRPNSYPGLLGQPKTMAVVGSECGSYDSLCKLLHSAFRCADRVYAMVPWGNYVAVRAHDGNKMTYFLFDGCTCNVNRFRYLDLTCGTAGLLYFEEMHKMINYIIMSRSRREEIKNLKRCVVDDVCKEMYGTNHI
ncbi:uncharacterized protein LOC111685313 [Lucilia cuprina]|uniref:uncharacterized protein LOC111685313 n=1 Tax=Lucilia cuprina TaxID=7375 RepID=UPI001F05079F|nr:uncharacterized protein LOC111685313 [Lucilia cuprina]